MLTRLAADHVRSKHAVLNSAFADSEQLLDSAVVYPAGQATGRILFIPLKSEAGFEEAVYSTAIACLTRSYEVTNNKSDGFEAKREEFSSEILQLCESFPAPITEGGRRYEIIAVSTGAKVPVIKLRDLDAVPAREIRYDLLTQGRSFLISRFKGNSEALGPHLSTLKEIEAKWGAFKRSFGDIELLQKTAGKQPIAPAPSIAAIADVREAGLNNGILVFAGKTPFKACFKPLVAQKKASDIIGVAEIVHSKHGDQVLTRVQGNYMKHPLVVLHEPNGYFASWVQELRGVTNTDGKSCHSLNYLDTVVLDICDISFDSEENAKAQISAIKDQLALGEIRNVLCLVRISALGIMPALINKWERTGRPDVPVQVWHISRQQAAVLSDTPAPVQFDHSTQRVADSGFEQQQQQFRALLNRLTTIVRDLPGSNQLPLLSSLRDLYFRFVSFCDPVTFQHDSSVYLNRLESLERYVSGGIYYSFRTEATALLEQTSAFLNQGAHPLIRAAGKCLSEAGSSHKKSFRLGILSYNCNSNDQEYLVRYLTRFTAPGNTRPVKVEFFDAWNLPPPNDSQTAPLKLLVCFNLPRTFVTSLFFNRFARTCIVLCDQETEKVYTRSYHTVKNVYDQFVSDGGLLRSLNLSGPQESTFIDGKPCFDYSIPLPVNQLSGVGAESAETAEFNEDIESIISRLVQERCDSAQEETRMPRVSGQDVAFTLLLDQDGVLEAAASRKFYRIEEDSPEESEALTVSVTELKPGDYIVLFKRKSRENLNTLIDESLAKVELYSNALKTSNLWRDAVRRINVEKRQHLHLSEVFQRVGFERAPQTFDNYLDGNTTKPLQLKELLHAINAVSRMMPDKGIQSFTASETSGIIDAVDQLSRVRRMLPKALRAAVINRRSGRLNLLSDVYGDISPELLEAILQEVNVRRVREIIPVHSY